MGDGREALMGVGLKSISNKGTNMTLDTVARFTQIIASIATAAACLKFLAGG